MGLFDCHCHTERSECADDVTLAKYVDIARTTNQVFVVTDHSAHIFYPPDKPWGLWGEEAETLFYRHYEEGIERAREYAATLLAARTGGMLAGIELDVLHDGAIVFDTDLLADLDFVLGAVHGIRGLDGKDVERAVENQKTRTLALMETGVDVLAHPFREWAQQECELPGHLVEWIVHAARDAGVALEVNSHYAIPEFDLPMIRLCAENGVRLALGTDAHRMSEFGDFAYHREILQRAGIAESDWERYLLSAPVRRARDS